MKTITMSVEQFETLVDLLKGPCRHENYGTAWENGVKRVECLDCHKILWAVKVQ